MTPSAGWALQKAVFQALRDDSELTTLLGGQKIYDDVPQDTSFPYIAFGRTSQRDWSTGTDGGTEHSLTLHIWSRAAGRRQVFKIISRTRALLHDQPLAMTNHNLINMRFEFSEARRDNAGENFHGLIRFRAVTEPT